MPSEPRWVTADELIEINECRVAETGEPHFLLDEGGLESAQARPRNRWLYRQEEEDVISLAAALLYALVQNHPFEQGNKRTAATAAISFIESNGYRWVLADEGEFAEWVLALVQGHLSEEGLSEQMSRYVVDKDDFGTW